MKVLEIKVRSGGRNVNEIIRLIIQHKFYKKVSEKGFEERDLRKEAINSDLE